MAPIPDAPNLLKIAERLWDGRATVLVGAGFSRNAITVPLGSAPPPLWEELASAMKTELYHADADSAPTDPLRLAEEYEQTLSRDALNKLIAKSVADDVHEPGENHINLLTLPWTDVLTTNYDTLLERAAYKSGNSYSVVHSPKGLPQAPAPRIIKLHGSLPDRYPLIITEEDYRRYEYTHGPFVSLARTRLAEHSLVMVGFSGDDPNFLRWSGWVRDHLAPDAPPLYFVTVGLSAPKRALLEKRGIAPIDLGPAFLETDFPDSNERNREAIAAFISELSHHRPSEPLSWPRPRVTSSSGNTRMLSSLADVDDRTPSSTDFQRSVKDSEKPSVFVQNERLSDLLRRWKSQRNRYPGWTIAPLSVREGLWKSGTWQWYRTLTKLIPSLEKQTDLLLAKEFVWRLDTSLVPYFDEVADMLAQVLVRYNPAPGKCDIPNIESSGIGEEKDEVAARDNLAWTPLSETEWDWGRLIEAWVECVFYLLRCYRDNIDVEEFNKWKSAVAPLARRRPEWKAHLGYQTALLHLDHQEISLAAKTASRRNVDWPNTLDSFPLGEVWRGAILAEVGELAEAETVAKEAHNRLYERLTQVREPSTALRSQVGWAWKSLSEISDARKKQSVSPPTDQEGYLTRASIESGLVEDPNSRLREIEVALERPIKKVEGKREPDFDPGYYTISYSSGGSFSFDDHKYGIAYFRMLEVGGIPLRTGRNAFSSRKVVRAAAWARPLKPWLSYISLLRNASDVAVKEFTRPRIAGMASEKIEKLANVAFTGVEAATLVLKNDDRSDTGRLNGLLDILSRVAITKEELAIRVLDFIISISSYATNYADRVWYGYLGKIIERISPAISDRELAERIPKLLSFPLVGRDLACGGALGFWFEPFEKIRGVPLDVEAINRNLITDLLEVLKGSFQVPEGANLEQERPIAQAYAAIRLSYLYRNGGLTSGEARRFSDAYWGHASPEGIPNFWGIHPMHFALRVPDPPSGMSAKDRVRKALLDADWEVSDGISPTEEIQRLLWSLQEATENPKSTSGGHCIDWSPKEAGLLVEKIAEYWNARHQKLLDAREREEQQGVSLASPSVDILREGLEKALLVLSDVAMPRLDESDEQHQAMAKKVLSEMADADFPVSIACPILIRFGYDATEAREHIRRSLTSTQSRHVQFGAEAVYAWALLHETGRLDESPGPLIEELAGIVAVGRQPGLAPSSRVMARIVRDFPSLLNEDIAARLAGGLGIIRLMSTPPDSRDAWLRPEILEWELDEQDIRAVGARLAMSLRKWYAHHDKSMPDELETWVAIGENDPLPEVRREWRMSENV